MVHIYLMSDAAFVKVGVASLQEGPVLLSQDHCLTGVWLLHNFVSEGVKSSLVGRLITVSRHREVDQLCVDLVVESLVEEFQLRATCFG